MTYKIETTPGKIEVTTEHIVKHRPVKLPGVKIHASKDITTEVEGRYGETRTFEVDSTKVGGYSGKRISPTRVGVVRLVKAMYDAAKKATLKGDFDPEEISGINSALDKYDGEKKDFKKVAKVKEKAVNTEVISVMDIPQERLEELLK